MKNLPVILCLLISFVACSTPIQNYRQVQGTRYMLDLPNDFMYDIGVSGFVSEIDSSRILINEVTNPYSYEELLNKRIRNAHQIGIDTSGFTRSTLNGYRSLEYDLFDPVLGISSFNVSFGTDDFFVDISLEGSPERIEELKPIILNGKYDENLSIDYDRILGFTISYEGSKQEIFKKDANTINTREVDSFGNIVSYLNVTKMAKDMFGDFTEEESIDVMYEYYFPGRQYEGTKDKVIDGSKFIWKAYRINEAGLTEHNIIGLLIRDKFYLLVVGGGINEEKIELLLTVVESIKFRGKD